MNFKERTEKLDELSQIYSLGIHHYINAAIYTENSLLVRFFEQCAYDRMLFVDDLQYRIDDLEGNRRELSIEETIDNWQYYCSFQKLEETFFITNNIGWIDKKAILLVHELLHHDLSEESASLIMNQLLTIESDFIALKELLDYLN